MGSVFDYAVSFQFIVSGRIRWDWFSIVFGAKLNWLWPNECLVICDLIIVCWADFEAMCQRRENRLCSLLALPAKIVAFVLPYCLAGWLAGWLGWLVWAGLVWSVSSPGGCLAWFFIKFGFRLRRDAQCGLWWRQMAQNTAKQSSDVLVFLGFLIYLLGF